MLSVIHALGLKFQELIEFINFVFQITHYFTTTKIENKQSNSNLNSSTDFTIFFILSHYWIL